MLLSSAGTEGPASDLSDSTLRGLAGEFVSLVSLVSLFQALADFSLIKFAWSGK